MKKIILSVFAITLVTAAFKPEETLIGRVFPSIECEDYNGKKINLPTEEKDKCTILGIAFSNDAEKELQLWIDPICNKFDPKVDEKNIDPMAAAVAYDVNLFFIPKFSFLNKVASKQSKEKIKTDSDKGLYQYLLFYNGSRTLKNDLEVEKKDIPYIFVLDKNGKIVYQASSKYDSKKLSKLTDAVDNN